MLEAEKPFDYHIFLWSKQMVSVGPPCRQFIGQQRPSGNSLK